MSIPDLTTDRFTAQEGLRVTAQVPLTRIESLKAAVLTVDSLRHGDYDQVSFQSAIGAQAFRSIGTGRNAETLSAVTVPCVELSFFIPNDPGTARAVLKALYAVHPYEEPVIFIEACIRTLHIRGKDEDNPARFWNAPPEDWIPDEHL